MARNEPRAANLLAGMDGASATHPDPRPSVAWVDGAFVAWDDAKLHVDTQGVLGGLNAYEVIGEFWVQAEKEIHLLRAADRPPEAPFADRQGDADPASLGPVTQRLQEALHLLMRNQAGHKDWLGRKSHST